jgi:secreted trypsin-like serine protease
VVTVAAALALLAGATASASASEPGTRIVGGSATTIEEWPWQVAIADHPDVASGDGYDRQYCGGSLVASRIVITAAHCADDPGPDFADPNQISAIVGRTTLSSSQGQEIDVSEVYYFVDDGSGGAAVEAETAPGTGNVLFDDDTLEWDAVFLELASSASAPAASIKIAGPGETATWAPGRTAFVTGWGRTETGGFPDRLREARIEIISDAACGSNSVYGPEFFPETMVCAGFLEGGVDTCAGDSGGPLVVPLLAGGFRLVGSTSWGFSCAQPNAPGVYGRLADAPLRSALAAGILDVAGANVLGSGGQPPTVPPPPDGTPPASDEPPTSSAACQDAESRLDQAKRRLRRAKKKLKRADTAAEERRAKRGVRKAKRRARRARNALAVCSAQPVRAS